MRYVVFGAGAIGATIGGGLHEGGLEVILIARGAHVEALQEQGLRLCRPEGDVTLRIQAVGAPTDIDWRDDDVVITAMKSQHTTEALERLARVTPADTSIVCAQNGVDNERMALRRFRNVYGMCVMMPATFLDPGVVHAYGTPHPGVLDVGRYPSGIDDRAERIVDDLNRSGFNSEAQPDIMAHKYRKLLGNLSNAVDALCGAEHRNGALSRQAREEAVAVFAAAGIALADEADEARRRQHLNRAPVAGREKPGTSSYQSLAKGADSTEVDYLNGEIVLLGRLHDVPTPVNELLQRETARATRDGIAPGSVPIEELETRLEDLKARPEERPTWTPTGR